jgi:hypothetical protein
MLAAFSLCEMGGQSEFDQCRLKIAGDVSRFFSIIHKTVRVLGCFLSTLAFPAFFSGPTYCSTQVVSPSPVIHLSFSLICRSFSLFVKLILVVPALQFTNVWEQNERPRNFWVNPDMLNEKPLDFSNFLSAFKSWSTPIRKRWLAHFDVESSPALPPSQPAK